MGLFNKKKKEEAFVENHAAAGPDNQENDELIAVIAAAIAAYEAEHSAGQLYIRKLNRTAGTRPVWGVMGTNEAIDMRRL